MFPIQERGVSMTTNDPNTTAAPASTATTAPAATTNKKPASLKAVTGFGKLDPNALATMARHVAAGIGGNAVLFANPPIDPAALDASGNTLAEAVLAAMDGGKTAKAVVKKQHKLIVQDLNLLAVFDPATQNRSRWTFKSSTDYSKASLNI
jgi:hypothetical protein